MKVVAVFVNPVLFAFSFSLAMGHTAFTTLADRAVHVLGQFQHFNQICKLLHGKCIVVNAKVGEEQTSFLQIPVLRLTSLGQSVDDESESRKY